MRAARAILTFACIGPALGALVIAVSIVVIGLFGVPHTALTSSPATPCVTASEDGAVDCPPQKSSLLQDLVLDGKEMAGQAKGFLMLAGFIALFSYYYGFVPALITGFYPASCLYDRQPMHFGYYVALAAGSSALYMLLRFERSLTDAIFSGVVGGVSAMLLYPLVRQWLKAPPPPLDERVS